MAYNKVELSGVKTQDLPILTDEEKKTLLMEAQAGNADAREKLIYGNLRLVLSVVGRFSSRRIGESRDDLFQVGCMGLMKAIDRFDLGLDVKFSTYAVPMIIGEIRRHLRDSSTLRVSRSMRDLAYRAMMMHENLLTEFAREPTADEVAQRLGVSVNDVNLACDAVAEPISFYEPVFSDDGDSLYVVDRLTDSHREDEEWLTGLALRDAMAHLSERERNILRLRYFADKTQCEIAEEIGISQAQVSRVEKGALEKLRREME